MESANLRQLGANPQPVEGNLLPHVWGAENLRNRQSWNRLTSNCLVLTPHRFQGNLLPYAWGAGNPGNRRPWNRLTSSRLALCPNRLRVTSFRASGGGRKIWKPPTLNSANLELLGANPPPVMADLLPCLWGGGTVWNPNRLRLTYFHTSRRPEILETAHIGRSQPPTKWCYPPTRRDQPPSIRLRAGCHGNGLPWTWLTSNRMFGPRSKR